MITIREKKSRGDWIWGDYGESPHVFGFVHQMDENDDAVNQPNQIKGKNELVHDLKQFCYKNQLLIKIHFFICYILNDRLCSLQVHTEEIMKTAR